MYSERSDGASAGGRISIRDGVHVAIGQQLTAGQVDPQDVLRIRGLRKVQEHLVEELRRVCAEQGLDDLTIYPMKLYMRPTWMDRK